MDAKLEKLYNQVYSELVAFMWDKGYAVANLPWTEAIVEYILTCKEDFGDYSISDWYTDTLNNYPVDFDNLPRAE